MPRNRRICSYVAADSLRWISARFAIPVCFGSAGGNRRARLRAAHPPGRNVYVTRARAAVRPIQGGASTKGSSTSRRAISRNSHAEGKGIERPVRGRALFETKACRHSHALRFASRTEGDLLYDGDLPWHLEGGESFSGEVSQHRHVERGDTGRGDDGGANIFPQRVVSQREHDRLGDRWVRKQHFFDFPRTDLFAAPVNELFQAAGQPDVAVRVDTALVASAKPVAGERECGRIDAFVACCNGRAADSDFSLVAGGGGFAVRRERAHLNASRNADGPAAPLARRRRVGCHLVRRFGHVIRLDDRDAERLFEVAKDRGRERG